MKGKNNGWYSFTHTFGIDDGPIEIEESIDMIRQAVSVGYTDIVCSSHYLIGRFEILTMIKTLRF